MRTLLRALFALAVVGLLSAPLTRAAHADDVTVAVMYFESSGNPELEMLRVGLAQMMITNLQGTEGTAIVERTRLQEILAELELSRSDMVDPEVAARVGRLLGAQRMVLGSYFELLGTLTLNARVVEVETGVILASEMVSGEKQTFPILQANLSDALRPALTMAGHSRGDAAGEGSGSDVRVRGAAAEPASDEGGESAGGDAAPPPSATVRAAPSDQALDAALAFSEGLDYLDRQDVTRAREALERAIELDPSLEEARTQLASMEI